MSEADKYVEAVYEVRDFHFLEPAAAYLREHFVTREEYEALQAADRVHLSATRGMEKRLNDTIATLTAERDRLRAALDPFARVARIQGRWSMEWPDDKPNIEFIPSAWPDWGDFKRAELALNPEDV